MGMRRFLTVFLFAALAAMFSCAHKRIVLKSPDGSEATYESTADTSIEGLEFTKLADGSTTLKVTKSDQQAAIVNQAMWSVLAEVLRRVPVAPGIAPAAAPVAAPPAPRSTGLGPHLEEASQ